MQHKDWVFVLADLPVCHLSIVDVLLLLLLLLPKTSDRNPQLLLKHCEPGHARAVKFSIMCTVAVNAETVHYETRSPVLFNSFRSRLILETWLLLEVLQH